MRRPFMPMYWGDYHADTAHLETAQHGAYLLLLAHYWMNESLPDDDKSLAKITGLPVHSWRQMRPRIQAFFYDGWRHKRVEEEWARYDEKVARLKVAGSNGGTKAKIARDKARELAGNSVAYASSQAIAGIPQKTPDPSYSTLNHNHIITSSFPTAAREEAEKKRLGKGEAGAGTSPELNDLMASKWGRP